MSNTTEIRCRSVAYSRVEQVHIVMPADVNAGFSLFGGTLMQWIDIVAAVVARRHAGGDVRTAAVDHLDFLEPAYVNDIVTLIGRVTFVGNTSMEICVDTYIERMDDCERRYHVNRAFLTMVAVDRNGKPRSVPRLSMINDIEREDFEAGRKRREARQPVRTTESRIRPQTES